MKIAVITLLDNKNYGNRWQNYAMNALLRSVGIETENIYFWVRNADRDSLSEKVKRRLPIRLAYRIHICRAYQIDNAAMFRRVLRFSGFTRKYMGARLILVNTHDELQERIRTEEYDYFAVGSDQVWNPYYLADPVYFLDFAERGKRLAFMASFGSDEIPADKVAHYRKGLSEMTYISVREPAGARLVEELTGKTADVFLDPTLLLEREKWIGLARKPGNVTLPDSYAVSFMFDSSNEYTQALCDEKGLELLLLNDRSFQKLYSLDPAEMLYVIDHSRMIFTDSFHVMALSIKLNKQFYVFNRPGFEYMFGRLRSVLERLCITDCIFDRAKFRWEPVSDKQFKRINRILEEQRTAFTEKISALIFNSPKGEIHHERGSD